MPQTTSIRSRRRWPLLAGVFVIVVAGLWSGLWYYAAATAERTVDGWKLREAKSGRIYSCASQTVSGFPFRFELHCAAAGAELKSNRPPVELKAKDLLVTAQLWQPTVLTSHIVGPLTIAEPGRPVELTANWQSAESRVRGLPTAPERVSITVEQPVVDGVAGGTHLFKASRMELEGRMVSGTVRDNPVIEIALKLMAATAPYWHEVATAPVDASITAVLHGLKDFAPKSWPVRLRELQMAGGRIEIAQARVQQGDTIAVAGGTVGLSPSGRLDGQLRLTVANLDQLLPKLGLDRMLEPKDKPNQLDGAFGALDRLMPGLGQAARKNAGPMIIVGINMMGTPAELEGRRAVTLPLRFNDGAVSLGSILVGYTPPLF